ncbi:MAG TPA: HAMP domain-containing sensor histidine kinase [Clostridia bacterium]|jgi:signal transduction histidine kinase|nr:HAMP domain-containing histidine kinase [Clostridiaceae bacterium]HOF26268.1 HAMP domain-containing sensor histidine kinase [Clostridia bacterium]HOM35046.1 HAMP domain-containing sensor histidine kinase [Clostridia bacterium]HOR89556.1 HAMP domain-containing sensor histidine kinase [Clostridia bacterium]HOT70038.1 HAMP domain-containing sensor histidine kinase [Clostridia bacterium]
MQLKSKLSIFLLVIIVVASVFAYMGAILVSNKNFIETIKENQRYVAETILSANKETDLPLERIIAITHNALYPVKLTKGIDDLRLSDTEKALLENGIIVFIKQRVIPVGISVVKTDEYYLRVGYQPENNLFRNYAMLLAYAFLFSIVVFMLIIMGLSNKAMKPIVQLNNATQEVAKGNFDVVVVNDSQDEIGQLTESFNKMAKELKSIEYLRKDFVSNVSHEFKTPISSILGFAKLLESPNLTDEEKKEYLDIIVEESKRLSNLSTNILNLSKLESQEIVFNKSEYSLDEQIRNVILLLEPKWYEKSISFDIEMEHISFYANEDLMQQVWINLFNNAITYSHPKGVVHIKMYNEEEKAVIVIQDEGIGMDEYTKNRMFEKFFKGDTVHSKEGTGLGLALVKRIIDLHNGAIEVESKPGEGTTIKLIFPNEFRGWEVI